MARLTKIGVTYISLVERPANKLDIIYKSEDINYTDEKQIAITKSTPEGLVYGTVYAPNVKDADGDWADAATIKKAAHDFLRKGRNANVDIQHSEKPSGAHVVESHVTETGAWAVAIQMDPQGAEFSRVQKGELKGLSMGAWCEKVNEEPPASGGMQSDNQVAEALVKMQKSLESLSEKVNGIEAQVKAVPKSRQLVIEGDEVHHVEKNDAGGKGKFREFVFSDLA